VRRDDRARHSAGHVNRGELWANDAGLHLGWRSRNARRRSVVRPCFVGSSAVKLPPFDIAIGNRQKTDMSVTLQNLHAKLFTDRADKARIRERPGSFRSEASATIRR
jgi:hypothetical protein